jgi:hypothetical protein
MEVHLSHDQEALIRESIAEGRLSRPEEAFEQAMSLWEERERSRMELLADIEAGDLSLAQGLGRTIRSRDELAQMVKDVSTRAAARMRHSG